MAAKTPEQIASETGGDKGKVTLYLNLSNVEYLKRRAAKAGTSASKLIDEAIAAYIRQIKDPKTD